MDFVLSLLLQTALVPAVVSVMFVFALGKFDRVTNSRGAIALGVGFFAGWCTQEWTTLQPVRYLDWLPWVGLTLSVAAIVFSKYETRTLQGILLAAGCAASAWLLVPNFPRMQPSRIVALGIVATVSVLMVVTLEKTSKRIDSRLLITCLMATGTAASIVLAQSFAMKFAQIMGMLTAALVGSLLLNSRRTDQSQTGLCLIFLPLLTNLMFIGYANSSSDVPVFSYGLIALAPLGLCIVLWNGKTKESSSNMASVAGAMIVAAVLLMAVVPAILAHPPWEAE